MTNDDMRELLKQARTYNNSVNSKETWSTKVDSMHEAQVYEVYRRLSNCAHVYVVPTQLDGFPLGFYDSGKTLPYDDCTHVSKAQDKIVNKFLEEHPDMANAPITFVFAEELAYNDMIRVDITCKGAAWLTSLRAKNFGLCTSYPSEEDRHILSVRGDRAKVIEFLIKVGMKTATPDGYSLGSKIYKVEI